jgi:hypothetical protein
MEGFEGESAIAAVAFRTVSSVLTNIPPMRLLQVQNKAGKSSSGAGFFGQV